MDIETVQSRLMARVEFDTNGGCWLWSGSCVTDGYGHLTIRAIAPRPVRAHRLSWRAHCGEIPEGLHVLHSCDVPQCINPSHLFLGTHSDNMADKAAKGRVRCTDITGERAPWAKLSDADIIDIRSRLARGERQKDIGGRFGVTQTHISKIKHLHTRTGGHVV